MAENEKSPEEKKQHPTKEPAETKPSEGKETPERTDAVTPGPGAAKPDQQKKKEKKGKQTAKEDEPVKKKEHDENFNYIIRVVNTDINGESNIVQGLTQIKGIGRHMATFIADTAGVDRKLKFGNLPESEIEKLKEVLENIDEYAPPWMLNYRKDAYSGEDIHLISTDVTSRLRDDINMMKMIRSYRGVRHELGLKVRGQRSSSNGRKGLALGVSKRREAPAAAGKKEESKEK
ncbi:MAG TPA: 30S ribosomal protein S13 [Candidatus Thermoplasmatota archaeon]|nr:30S ribosomal protein S13 [Candidatus Thermoplasmatota archaeon]